MRLTYPTMPAAGTIVSIELDGKKRFIQVWRESYDSEFLGPFKMECRFMERIDIVDRAIGSALGKGEPPRSLLEHTIIRRTWTPYGYAKVFGFAAPCRPPVVRQLRPRPMTSAQARKKALKEIRKTFEAQRYRWHSANKLFKQRGKQ